MMQTLNNLSNIITSVAEIVLKNVQHSCHLREHQNLVPPGGSNMNEKHVISKIK